MTETLNLALQLLLVGMTSVFFILSVVAGLGRLLIYLVNKYSPTQVTSSKTISTSSDSVPDEHVAIISAIVELVSDNKGKVVHIEKLQES